MFEKLIHLDQQLLVFLNNLGTKSVGRFGCMLQTNTIGCCLYNLLNVKFKYLGWKKGAFCWSL